MFSMNHGWELPENHGAGMNIQVKTVCYVFLCRRKAELHHGFHDAGRESVDSLETFSGQPGLNLQTLNNVGSSPSLDGPPVQPASNPEACPPSGFGVFLYLQYTPYRRAFSALSIVCHRRKALKIFPAVPVFPPFLEVKGICVDGDQ